MDAAQGVGGPRRAVGARGYSVNCPNMQFAAPHEVPRAARVVRRRRSFASVAVAAAVPSRWAPENAANQNPEITFCGQKGSSALLEAHPARHRLSFGGDSVADMARFPIIAAHQSGALVQILWASLLRDVSRICCLGPQVCDSSAAHSMTARVQSISNLAQDLEKEEEEGVGEA